MSPELFRQRALALRGATYDQKWGSDIFSVGAKMFAARSGRTGAFSFKASDMAFTLLIESGAARPAPHLARAKWVQLFESPDLTDEEIAAYLAQAHGLVARKLTRKLRLELGL